MKCNQCDGTGYLLGAAPDRGNPKCDNCQGTGEVNAPEPVAETRPAVTCPLCRGRCQVPQDKSKDSAMVPCPRCDGTGERPAPEPLLDDEGKPVTLFGAPVMVNPDLPPTPAVTFGLPRSPSQDARNIADELNRAVETANSKPAPPVCPVASHSWLKAKLYEPCTGCAGTGRTATPMMVNKFLIKSAADLPAGFDPPAGGYPVVYSGRLPLASPCPLCSGAKFVETGLTVGQVERFRAQAEECIKALAMVVHLTAAFPSRAVWSDVNTVAGNAIAKCGSSGAAAVSSVRREAQEKARQTKPPAPTEDAGGQGFSPD